MAEFWGALLDSDYRERWGFLLFAVATVVAGIWTVWKHREGRRQSKGGESPRGGRGGNASVRGNGTALGGRGGRAGDLGHGGAGGHANVAGSGTAIGGDGGDGGVSWRPSLGAPSAAERLRDDGLSRYLPRDEFGFIQAGRGGAGGEATQTVRSSGLDLPFLPMLQLLRLWHPDILTKMDEHRPDNAQDGWEYVKDRFPQQAFQIENYVSHCIDHGSPPFDPYRA